MKLEQLDIDTYKNLMQTTFEEMGQMVAIINPIFLVEYANLSLLNFFKKEASEVKNKNIGDVIGCGHIEDGKNESTKTSFCKMCEIRTNFHKVFDKVKEKAEFDIVREYEILGEKLVHHLKFKVVPIELNNKPYALCFIDDLAEHDAFLLQHNQPD